MTGSVFAATELDVDAGSFLAIVATAAIAGTLCAVAGGLGVFIPVVVVELVLGVLIGPQLLDLAHVDSFTEFFGDLGLGMLFFFAGYEIDIERIRGEPLRLGLAGWALSLVIAYSLGGILAAFGVVVSLVYVGSALATTAIGTLIPGPLGHGRAGDGLRPLPAGGRGGRGVRADPPAHAGALDAERGAQRAHPRRVRRARGGRRRARGAVGRADRPDARADDRDQLAARGPLDRRARVRARAARRPSSAWTCSSAGSPPA